MQLLHPPTDIAPYGLRAMAAVGRAASGGLGPAQRSLLAAAQRVILHTDLDIDALAPIEPDELARHLASSGFARQLIQGMVVMGLCDGPATPEQARLIKAFAGALAVDEPAVGLINRLAEHELLLFRFDFYRRSHMRDMIESQYRNQGGIVGVAKGLLGLRGLVSDPELASRFDVLGDLPSDTLGYAFHRHYRVNGFAFPGEPGGFPIAGAYHDFIHVLADYPTTPEGEIQVGAFNAGLRRSENAFFILLFVVLTFSSGINMTPLPQPEAKGILGRDDVAAKMLLALERGGQVNTDLADDWDFWPFVTLPLDEARRRLNIVPA